MADSRSKQGARACWMVAGLLSLGWLAATCVVMVLQCDKASMTLLREEELKKLFFPTEGSGKNATIESMQEDAAKQARKSASVLYRWLAPGSPRQLLPWQDVVDETWLKNATAEGHCGGHELALLAVGKIDEDRCGDWAKPRSDGCAPGFVDHSQPGTGAADDDGSSEGSSSDLSAVSPPAGTFAPDGFTCFVLCVSGASCGESSLASGASKCAWPVTLKHADGHPYEGDTCPGVAYETLCPGGYFCTTPAARPERCPHGHYCPVGSFKPTRCPFFATCDVAGLDAPNVHVAAAAALLGLFALALFLLQTSKFVRRSLARVRERVREKRLEMREQYLERRASRLARRVFDGGSRGGFASGHDDDEEEEDDDALRRHDEYLCGWIARGGSLSDEDEFDEEDDAEIARRRRNSRTGLVEMPPTEYVFDSDAGDSDHLDGLSSDPTGRRSSRDGLLRVMPEKPLAERVSIAFENLGLSVASAANGRPKVILEAVSGELRAGSVTALLGPSGAGKSSLLKVLSSRLQQGTDILAEGTRIAVNGCAIPLRVIAPLTALAPQDDVMHRELSVLEILDFSAAMRLPTSTYPTRQSRSRLVRDVIASLGLRPVRHSIVGGVTRGISGGQRKRVNIGMEIVSDPSVLLCDEPTSGLDSATSLMVVKVFRALARKGVNVAAVIHQPALQLYLSFSDVLLLAPGGRTAYHGPPADAAAHFEGRLKYSCPKGWSKPDYYMQLLVSHPHHLSVCWRDRPRNRRRPDEDPFRRASSALTVEKIEAAAEERLPPSWLTQLRLQTARALLRQRRVLGSIAGDIVVQTLCGGGIGLLYIDYTFHNAQLVNFMVSISLGMTMTLAGVPTFSKRDVFLRECCRAAGGGLSPTAYFAANCLADIPRFVALATVFVLGFYPLAHPRTDLWLYCLAAVANGFAASGFGYVASCLFDESGSLLAALCMALIFALFAGVHPTFGDMPIAMRVVNYASHDRYFIELLFVEEVVKMSEAFRMPPSFYSSSSDSVLAQLLNYGYMVSDFSILFNYFLRWLDIATLVALGFAARLLAYVLLVNINGPVLGRQPWTSVLRKLLSALLSAPASLVRLLSSPATDAARVVHPDDWRASVAQPLV